MWSFSSGKDTRKDFLKRGVDNRFDPTVSFLLTHTNQTLRLCPPLAFTKGVIMTRRNIDWVQRLGLAATVCAMSALVITDGLQWTSAPAYASEERRDRRDDRQDDRKDA